MLKTPLIRPTHYADNLLKFRPKLQLFNSLHSTENVVHVSYQNYVKNRPYLPKIYSQNSTSITFGTFNLVYNVQSIHYDAKQAVLFALASNGLTIRRTFIWNSSPWLIDLTSCLLFWKPLTVHRLVDHVQILQNDSNCNMTGTVLTRIRLTCSELPKTVPPSNSVHQREIQFYLSQQNFIADCCWVCDHQKWFSNPVFHWL